MLLDADAEPGRRMPDESDIGAPSNHGDSAHPKDATNCTWCGLETTHRAVRLPGSSHAESALASRGDVGIANDIGVVELVEEKAVGYGRRGNGLGLLVGDGLLEEGGGEADKGEEG